MASSRACRLMCPDYPIESTHVRKKAEVVLFEHPDVHSDGRRRYKGVDVLVEFEIRSMMDVPEHVSRLGIAGIFGTRSLDPIVDSKRNLHQDHDQDECAGRGQRISTPGAARPLRMAVSAGRRLALCTI